MSDSEREAGYLFQATLPAELSRSRLHADLEILCQGVFIVSVEPKPGRDLEEKLGQLHTAAVDIVLQILDTKTSAAAAQTIIGAVMGYLFAKTGKLPKEKDKTQNDLLE